MTCGKISVTPGFLLLMAWLYYSGRGKLAFLVLVSSCLHEAAHYMTLRLFGARVERLKISMVGAEMQVIGRLSYPGEILSAAAGPASNLMAALVLARFAGERGYVAAGLNLALAFFNLLPAPGLDGGRCLAGLTGWLCGPHRADALNRAVSGTVGLCAAAAGLTAFILGGNVTGLLAGFWLCSTCVGKIGRMDGKKGLSFRAETGTMVHV